MVTSVRDRLTTLLLVVSFGLLLLVGVAGPSAAKPGLGPRGWAPGELGWAPGSALVTAMLWAAYLVGGAAVGLRLLGAGHIGEGAGPGSVRGPGRGLGRVAGRVSGWVWPAVLAVLALLTGPFGSADHTNYAAYGRIAALGGDPYLTSPSAFSATDPVTTLVEPPWTDTVSIYGPVATMLQSLASHLGGANLRQTVWVWQLLVVLAWLGVRALLLRAGADRSRVATLWTLNPVVFGIAVLGAHVDLLAAALALGALVLASRSPGGAGLLAGAAVSAKITYGVVAVGLLLAWWGRDRAGFTRRAVAFAVGALLVVVPAHLWAGPHVFDQLDRARRSISLATPWRLLYELLSGPIAAGTVRTLVTWLSALLALGLAVVLARLTHGLAPGTVTGVAARWTLVLGTAYTVAAPYSLPWYDAITWVTLPLLAASRLDGILLLRSAALALAYVPGRVVGMTPTVERVTLAVRRRVVPYAVLLVWGLLTLAAARGWTRRPAPRPPAP